MAKKLGIESLLLSLIAIGVLVAFSFVSAEAKRVPSIPATDDPTGDLVITSAEQLLARVTGYVRIYDWVNGEFNHTWSGVTNDNVGVRAGAIGDVDNDGTKEVVSYNVVRTKIKGQYLYARTLKIWNNGDASDSPSITKDISGSVQYMEIGDVDRDGKNELVMIILGLGVEVWNCTSSDCTKETTINNLGSGGLTLADADNDGYDEILVGMGSNEYGYRCHGLVIDYSGGSYSVAGDLGPANTQCCIDELSVGDLDGTSGNEIFGSGYCNGSIFVWRYADGSYNQVWTEQRNNYYDQNNEIADINGDGKNEFAFTEAGGNNYLVVYSYSGNNAWTTFGEYANSHGTNQDAMVSGDPDGDGDAELVVEDQVWDWGGSTMSVIQNLTGTIKDVAMG